MVIKKRMIMVNRKKTPIKLKFVRGELEEAFNPKGKGKVVIVQRGDFIGFTALSKNLKGRRIDRAKSAEKLVARLIRKGKKHVKIID